MTEHGRNWTDNEIRASLVIWAENIQRQLLGATRNATVFQRISQELQQHGYVHDEDHDIFLGFKWFKAVHSVMPTRAVVSPPALLDTASIGSRSN